MTLEVSLRHRVDRLDLDVAFAVGEETLGLVGPSGAGKSTILRATAGLVKPQHGRITHAGRALLDTAQGIDLAPESRSVGIVFQDGALFPFMNVGRNVAYGAHGNRSERRRSALRILERFGIAGLAAARPAELSGGQRRRVALARAIGSNPKILLFDEPLSALDVVTKAEVATELATRLGELKIPTILVSHDFADVVGLADRVAVLQEGRIVQLGAPSELVEAPASSFVASLAGVNHFTGIAHRRESDLIEVTGEGWSRSLRSTDEVTGSVGVGVYPWEISIAADVPAGSALNAVAGTVRRVTVIGNRTRVAIDGPPNIVAEVTEESARSLGLAPGMHIVASWKATATRLVPHRA